jgi:hypothetical protein
MTSPATITVGPSLGKILGGVTIATIAITIGAVALVLCLERAAAAGLLGLLPVPPWLWSHRWGVVAALATLLGCYRGIAVLGALLWARPRIEIGEERFTDYGVVGKRSRRWSEVEGSFTIIQVGWPIALFKQPVVAYRLTDAGKKAAGIKQPIELLPGFDEAILICGELAIEPGELADVLNECKRCTPSAGHTE